MKIRQHIPRKTGAAGFLSRLGLPPALAWGFLDLLLFMLGDGVELGYMSTYGGDRGLSGGAVASIFTVYRLTADVVGRLSGALSHAWEPRRVITLELFVWLACQVAFLTALMPSLAPYHKGKALSLLSLGAGASVWVGPALVGLLLPPIGVKGVLWVFAGLCLPSGLLSLTLPDRAAEAR